MIDYPDNPLPGQFPVPCPACQGDGGHEGPFCHVDYRNGSAWGDWYECTYCGGSGDAYEDCLPDDIDGDELDDYREGALDTLVYWMDRHTPADAFRFLGVRA